MEIREASCNSTVGANALARATAKLCGLVAHLLDDLVDEVWEVAEDIPVAFLGHSPDCDHAVQDALGSHVQDL